MLICLSEQNKILCLHATRDAHARDLVPKRGSCVSVNEKLFFNFIYWIFATNFCINNRYNYFWYFSFFLHYLHPEYSSDLLIFLRRLLIHTLKCRAYALSLYFYTN